LNQVSNGIYRALDVILISAARQVAHDNEFASISPSFKTFGTFAQLK
jgi:hypothetical protein